MKIIIILINSVKYLVIHNLTESPPAECYSGESGTSSKTGNSFSMVH